MESSQVLGHLLASENCLLMWGSCHTHTCAYTETHRHTCTHAHRHTYTERDIHGCTYTPTHMHTQIDIHADAHAHTRAYTERCRHMCTHRIILNEVLVLKYSEQCLIYSRWWWWFSQSVVSNSCNPMNCNPLGSSVHGISRARLLKWVAVFLSRGSSRPRG